MLIVKSGLDPSFRDMTGLHETYAGIEGRMAADDMKDKVRTYLGTCLDIF